MIPGYPILSTILAIYFLLAAILVWLPVPGVS